MSNISESIYTSSTGAQLKLYATISVPNAKGVVHIAHGMCEHARRYKRFMNHLADNGYHTYAHDHRGHGETKAEGSFQGSFAEKDGWNQVLADMDAINDHIKSLHNKLPIIAFGHSMGSSCTGAYVLNHPQKVDGVAMWNGSMTGFLPNLLVQLLKVERMFKGSDVASTVADGLTFQAWNKAFKPNRTQSDWLSSDEAEVDKYVADANCGFPATIGMWIDLLTGMRDLANEDKIAKLKPDLPFHILAGKLDPCSTHGKAADQMAERLRKSGLTDITSTIVPDARHETLNETNRQQHMNDFVSWLDARFAN